MALGGALFVVVQYPIFVQHVLLQCELNCFRLYIFCTSLACNKVLDIAYVIDTSGSVSADQHKRNLRFISKLTDEFEV